MVIDQQLKSLTCLFLIIAGLTEKETRPTTMQMDENQGNHSLIHIETGANLAYGVLEENGYLCFNTAIIIIV